LKKIFNQNITTDNVNSIELINKFKHKIFQDLSTNQEFESIINLSAVLLSKWNKFPFIKGIFQ
jgi:hypothetical protein